MRASPLECDHAVFVGGRKTLAGGHECNVLVGLYTEAVFFHVFLKFKRGMLAVSSIHDYANSCTYASNL